MIRMTVVLAEVKRDDRDRRKVVSMYAFRLHQQNQSNSSDNNHNQQSQLQRRIAYSATL
jgi:hypothetical protein